MGMSIDEVIRCIEEKFKTLQDEYTHLMGKYQMMQANYETRLKADMVAMLTDIQLEIEELYPNPELNTYYRGVGDCSNLIQQKIDSLKADKGGE